MYNILTVCATIIINVNISALIVKGRKSYNIVNQQCLLQLNTFFFLI